MTVRFIYRELGNHHEIYSLKMTIIPRVGDLVTIGTRDTYTVHEVNFVLGTIDENIIEVLVK